MNCVQKLHFQCELYVVPHINEGFHSLCYQYLR